MQLLVQVLIELDDVHKRFGSKRVLQGCNIQIRRGEAVGIIGGSGSGKSTTLRLMAGLMAPDWVRGVILLLCWRILLLSWLGLASLALFTTNEIGGGMTKASSKTGNGAPSCHLTLASLGLREANCSSLAPVTLDCDPSLFARHMHQHRLEVTAALSED